jgi:hypothetical protein
MNSNKYQEIKTFISVNSLPAINELEVATLITEDSLTQDDIQRCANELGLNTYFIEPVIAKNSIRDIIDEIDKTVKVGNIVFMFLFKDSFIYIKDALLTWKEQKNMQLFNKVLDEKEQHMLEKAKIICILRNMDNDKLLWYDIHKISNRTLSLDL